MSRHMNMIYKRNSRKRAKDRQKTISPKVRRTIAGQERDQDDMLEVKGNTLSTDWDAGEGPSTRGRKFNSVYNEVSKFSQLHILVAVITCFQAYKFDNIYIILGFCTSYSQ